MNDRMMRERIGKMPVPSFETTAFVRPPELARACVAIVTSAGLFGPEHEPFAGSDQSFRLLDSSERRLRLGHMSPNFDRVAVVADLNVVYPIDRLGELAREGRIGRVAPRHVSFVGNQDETMTAIRLDSGPEAARALREDGVDVALFTPV
jgi:D-proline reductase (dithiol) PrdB